MILRPTLITVHNPKKRLHGDWFVEPKIDGCRIIIEIVGGKASVYSRTGIFQPRLQCFGDHLAALYNQDIIIDAELFARDLGSTITVMRADMSDEERLSRARVHQFDALLLSEAQFRTSAPIEERKARLLTSQYAHVIPWQVVPGSDLRGHLAPALALGYEGVVYKQAGSKYAFSRSNIWQKHKPQRKNKKPCCVAITGRE